MQMHDAEILLLSLYSEKQIRVKKPNGNSCFVSFVRNSCVLFQSLVAFFQVTALICCIIWMFINVPRSGWWILTRLVTASFIVSIPWTWWHLYKVRTLASTVGFFLVIIIIIIIIIIIVYLYCHHSLVINSEEVNN